MAGGVPDGELTASLARYAASLTFETLPLPVVEIAAQCFLDWAGVAIAGRGEPLVAKVRDLALFEGGAPQATIVGHGARLSVSQAALVNGTMGHALDYDDVNMIGHPSAPVVPGVLALAEHLGSGGRDALTAFVAGYEIESRIGAFMGASHYARGWHSTATLGSFGAAAAAGWVLRLHAGQFRHAFGIAGTLAAGLKASFGTMAKPLHAGHAAQTGVRAALLASRGFEANNNILEAPQGFGATQSDSVAREAALTGPAAASISSTISSNITPPVISPTPR